MVELRRDLINIKDLENDVLKLGDKLKPLSTSYTQTSDGKDGDGNPKEKAVETDIDEGGRPNKKEEEKIEIAKNLIELNISIDDIIKATGLTKEEIEKLK